MYRNRELITSPKSFLGLQYHEEDNTWELYNIHNKDLHTHSRHKRVLVKIKKDIEHHRLPATRDLKTLGSYTRVTTNKRYLRQINKDNRRGEEGMKKKTGGFGSKTIQRKEISSYS